MTRDRARTGLAYAFSEQPVEAFFARGRSSMRARVARLRSRGWQIGQCAIAAALAWYVAKDLLGHTQPFFAPVVAVVSLGMSYGQRLRRVVEMSIGVAVGIFLGDLYTHVLGSGAWQIAVMVGIAMVVAVLLDASPLLVNQVAIQSLVVVTVLPARGDAAFLRWTDALIGGGVALVAASVVPQAPLRRPRERAAVVVRKLASTLRAASASIRSADVGQALSALTAARSTDGLINDLRAAADEGLSVVVSSPFRLRHRQPVRAMAELVDPLDISMRNARVLIRRVAVACYRGETIPSPYADLIDDLAAVTDGIAGELRAGRMATRARPALLKLARRTANLPQTEVLSAQVVLAQLRSLLADLLSITGLSPLAATDAVPMMGPERSDDEGRST